MTRVSPTDVAGPVDQAFRQARRLQQQGCFDEARRLYQRVLKAQPRHFGALILLGVLVAQSGRPAQAADLFRRAIDVDPRSAVAHNHHGNALRMLAQPEAALASYDQAIALQPGYAAAHINRGTSLRDLRRHEAALASYERGIALDSGLASAYYNRGGVLDVLQRHEAALASYERAIDLKPDYTDAHLNRGRSLHAVGRYEEAIKSLDRAIELQSNYAIAYYHRGNALAAMGRYADALESFRRTLSIDPEHAEARSGLAMVQIPAVPANAAQVAAKRAAFVTELDAFLAWLTSAQQVDEPAVVGRSQVFYLAYQETDNKEILERYGRVCCDLMQRWLQREPAPGPTLASTAARTTAAPALIQTSRSAGDLSRIRVGIASAHIREHSVYRALIQGWLQQLDPGRFEVGLFHLDTAEDALTTSAKASAAFYVGGTRTLPEWIDALRAANLDVLIYPEIGMHPLTLQLASLRLVRCQMVSWGHPETSGLPSMDYYLSAEDFESTQSDANYSEKLVRLAHLGCYYEPFDCPKVSIDLGAMGIDAERPLLICPGTPFKYAPACDGVWVEIARRLGRCQLLFFEPREAHLMRQLRERLAGVFRAAGLSTADYLRFVPWQPAPQFHALLRQADVFLDTIGFSGFNTAMQAAECHLPLVTHEGRFMRGRFGSAIAARMGLPELMTRSVHDYVQLAVRLAQDTGFRQHIRERMRVSSTTLFRDRDFIDSLATFLFDAVRRTPRHLSGRANP